MQGNVTARGINFHWKVLEWEEASTGRIREDEPELNNCKAVKVQYTNTSDKEDVRYLIVRHPLGFRDYERLLFDIEIAADNSSGFEFEHK